MLGRLKEFLMDSDRILCWNARGLNSRDSNSGAGSGHPWVLDPTGAGVGVIFHPWVAPAPDPYKTGFRCGFYSRPPPTPYSCNPAPPTLNSSTGDGTGSPAPPTLNSRSGTSSTPPLLLPHCCRNRCKCCMIQCQYLFDSSVCGLLLVLSAQGTASNPSMHAA
jgi:hypothetical protein